MEQRSTGSWDGRTSWESRPPSVADARRQLVRGSCLYLVEVFEPHGSVQEWADRTEELPTRIAHDEPLLISDVVPLQDVGVRRRTLARAIQPARRAARRGAHRHDRGLEDTDKDLFLARLDR